MKYRKLAVMFLSVLFLVGCTSNVEKEAETAKEKSIDIRDVAAEDIVYSFGEMDALIEYVSHFSNIEEYAKESDEVVYGEVSDIKYLVGGDDFCVAHVEVKVIQSLKGNYKEGDTITVVKDQGIFTVKEYMENGGHIDEEILKEYSEDELNQIYVHQMHDNDIMAEIGQKSVYFLGVGRDSLYYRLTWPLGEYVEVSDNCFVKVSHIYHELTLPYRLDCLKDPDIVFADTYTLEEIIAELGL